MSVVTMSLFLLLLLLPAIASGDLVSSVAPSTRSVNTRLLARSWPTSKLSPVCESWGFITDRDGGEGEDTASGWRFVERLLADASLSSFDDLLLPPPESSSSSSSSSSLGSSSASLSYERVKRLAVSSYNSTSPSSPLSAPLLAAHLGLRSYSPLCELHRGQAADVLRRLRPSKLSSPPDAFAYVPERERLYFDVEELLKDAVAGYSGGGPDDRFILNGEQPYAPVAEGAQTVLLYGHVPSTSFQQWHSSITAFISSSASPLLRYYLRFLGPVNYDPSSPLPVSASLLLSTVVPTVLKGYGARLDVKNTEYKLWDDEKDDTATDDVPAPAPGSSSSSSSSPPDSSSAAPAPSPPSVQRLALKASTLLARSGEPLEALRDLSANLPSLYDHISASAVSHKLKKAAAANEERGDRSLFGGAFYRGGATVFVNGILDDFNRRSIFAIMRTIKSEGELLAEATALEREFLPATALGSLSALLTSGRGSAAFSSSSASEAFGASPEPDASPIRIDVARASSDAVFYVNDLEKEAALDPDLEQYLDAWREKGMYGRGYGIPPPNVGRNTFTLAMACDPLRRKGAVDGMVAASVYAEREASEESHIDFATALLRSRYPVRVGLMIHDEADVELFKRIGSEALLERLLTASRDLSAPVTSAFVYALYRIGRELVPSEADVAEMGGKVPTPSKMAFSFLAYLHAASASGEVMTIDNVLDIFADMFTVAMSTAAREALEKNHLDNMKKYVAGVQFIVDRNIQRDSAFLNGIPLSASAAGGMQESFSEVLDAEQYRVTVKIAKRKWTNEKPKSIYAELLKGPKCFKRYHPMLGESDEEKKYLIAEKTFANADTVSAAAENVKSYLTLSASLDLDSVIGMRNLDSLLAFLNSTFVEPPVKGRHVKCQLHQTGTGNFGLLMETLVGKLPSYPTAAGDLLAALRDFTTKEGTEATLGNAEQFVSFAQKSEAATVQFQTLAKDALREIRKVSPATSSLNYVSVNGRYIDASEHLHSLDIEMLVNVEASRAEKVTSFVRRLYDASSQFNEGGYGLATGVSVVSSFIGVHGAKRRYDVQRDVERISKDSGLYHSWNVRSPLESSTVTVVAVLDPLSQKSQRPSALLLFLRDTLNVTVQLVIAPRTTAFNGPGGADVADASGGEGFKSYYRFVSDDSNGGAALFDNLPKRHILTLRMDVPETFVVARTAAILDTDNLRCDSKGCGDHDESDEAFVEYGLKGLVVAGQCYERETLRPPNGLQLVLRGEEGGAEVCSNNTGGNGAVYSDTVVMKNLGYWQLESKPGIWRVNIAPGSKGDKMFAILEGSYGDRPSEGETGSSEGRKVVVSNFLGDPEMLWVTRREGMEKEELLIGGRGEEGLRELITADSTITTTMRGEVTLGEASVVDDETIHVFSVATGHLYERFLKIMMLSVSEKSSKKVHFWLLENFLSPSFKASAAAMAESKGFEVSYVTYKWPEWLRGQTELQRIIWAYKILFLDVLFPLNVKKIIYVDADQIVRADLKELWDLDMQGAAYGYVPFCDSREETLGFQFWRSGYWKGHLKQLPYHISALYVVDLVRFRQRGVGDILRATYDSLSRDPNSLSNLDQDLPNFTQHQVPIFSLPQDWLWCESWCSDETKEAAKTIDLCNNPLFKEPKLDMAKRVIDGELFDKNWVEMDEEVRSIEKKYEIESIAAEMPSFVL